jgi:trigger factor
VEGIRERILPEVDDDFVKTVSDLESVADLEEQILEELTAQKELEEDNTFINQILDKILDDAEIKYPPQMVDSEIEGEIRELESRLNSQGMDLEMYLNIQNIDEDELREQIKPNAEKRITQGLVIGKISESEEFDINPEEITEEYQKIINDYFGEDDNARTEYMKSSDSIALLNRISSQYITKKTLDFLKAIALGEDYSHFFKVIDEDSPYSIEEGDDLETPNKQEVEITDKEFVEEDNEEDLVVEDNNTDEDSEE